MNRRELMGAAASTAALAAAPRALAAGTPAELNTLFDRFMQENMTLQPEFATSLGLDTGPNAALRSELSDRSLEGARKQRALNESQLARLESFDASALPFADSLNREIVLYGLRNQVADEKRFPFNGGGAGAPYVLNQMFGSAFHDAPDFLDSQQPVETRTDAEDYLARLSKLGRAIDQDSEVARHDGGIGAAPPDFVIDRTLTEIKALRGVPVDQSVMVRSLARRAAEKKIDGDWGARAAKLVDGEVNPALDRQIALLESLRAKATHDAGVWRLPDGDAYYRASVTFWTTTGLSGDEIHKLGLELVAKLSADADAKMRAQGLTQGTVGQRFRAMYDDPKYRYPNTDEGKAKLLADLNLKVAAVETKLPRYFGVLPKARLEIRRIPSVVEAGAPGGYYQPASLDGKRPAVYYLNLRDTAEVPSWALPTVTYHEGVPGHHLQLSVAQEAPLPLIRKVGFFSAYSEGWALYAEQLALEMGMYENDPMGELGYIHDAMLRAVRLVLDSGLNAKRWSREQSIRYFTDTIGDKDATATSEVERYCVEPGQGCGYMLGKMRFLALRQQAKTKLGDRFDIRKFHDAALTSGAVPLDVLPRLIDRYIASAA